MNFQKAKAKIAGATVAGVFQCIGGGILTLITLIVLMRSVSVRDSAVRTAFSAIFFAGSVWLLLRGAYNCTLASHAQKIQAAMEFKNRESLALLCQLNRLDLSHMVRELRTLASRGFFPGAYVDLYRREFVLVGGGPVPPMTPGATVLHEHQKASAVPIYLFGIAWLFYAITFPLYRAMDFGLAAVFSVLVFVLASRFFPKQTVIVEEARDTEPPKQDPINTGNSDLDEVLTTAMAHMNKLTEIDAAIANGKIDSQVQELVHICKQIFDYIKKNPAKLRQIRQFMNYYLPTTIGLLESYVELEQEPFKGDNIRASMVKIESSMDTILHAFHRELDNLYQDKALDISVDIEVLQNMLEQEGLGAHKLEDGTQNS